MTRKNRNNQVSIRLSLDNAEKVEKSLRNIGTQGQESLDKLYRAGLPTTKQLDKMRDKGKKLDKTFKEFNKTSKSLTGTLTTFSSALATIGGYTVFKNAISDALAFKKALAEVRTIFLGTQSDFEKLRTAALDLSNEFGLDAGAQLKSLYQIISSGVRDTNEAINLLTVSNKLAVAGITDVDSAAKTLSGTLNVYGKDKYSAEQVSDILFAGVREGITTITELSKTLGTVTPDAVALNISLEEVVGTLSFLTKGNIETTRAATGLRAVLNSIRKPSKEAADFAKKLGLEFSASSIQSKGLAKFLDEVRLKTGGSSDALVKLFGSAEALTPIFALLGQASGDYANILKSMNDSLGATNKAFEIINGEAYKNLERTGQLIKNFGLELADIFLEWVNPTLKIFNEDLNSVIQSFKELDQQSLNHIQDEMRSLTDEIQKNKAAMQKSKSPLYSLYSKEAFEKKDKKLRQEYDKLSAVYKQKTTNQAPSAHDTQFAQNNDKIVLNNAEISLDDLNDDKDKGLAYNPKKIEKRLADIKARHQRFIDQINNQYLAASNQQIALIESRRDAQLKTLDEMNLAESDHATARTQIIDSANLQMQKIYADNAKKFKEAEQQKLSASKDTATQILATSNRLSADAGDLGKNISDGFTSSISTMEDALVNFATTGKASFSDLANSILADIARIMVRQQIVAPLTSMLGIGLASMFGGVSSTGAHPASLATGGMVYGAGSPTADKVPVRLSPGEFVVNARASARHRPLLENLNRKTPQYIAPHITRGLAGGGMAGGSPASMMMGGNVNIKINNYSDANISAKQSQSSNGDMNIEIIANPVENHIADKVARDIGPLSRVLRARYPDGGKTSQ